ncbi:MAG TPA: cbb3-type cytochrome c oxidase N-terminal domain-containing protein [Chitinophagaceae bacterium]
MRKKTKYIQSLLAGSFLLATQPVFAAGPPEPSIFSHPLAVIMVMLMSIFLIIIAVLANKLIRKAGIKAKVVKRLRAKKSNTATLVTFLFLFLSSALFAQAPKTKDVVKATADTIGGLAPSTFYLMAIVLLAEMAVALVLFVHFRFLLTKEEKDLLRAEPQLMAKPALSWWDRFNKLRPVEQEADLDLGHDYDGIRELNNRLPPWWLYGFYLTIIIAGIYLWRFHIAHTGPSSKQEYERSVAIAEARIKETLKQKGETIDENTVTLLTAASDIAEGKLIFQRSCITCHKEGGGGDVGPNLTDDYWIHGGDIKNIFKTIRYGFNAMPQWQMAYSNKQIAQVASFVKSLKGTHPPNPKAPQGELYKEETKPVTDSASLKEKKKPVNQ